MEYYFSGKIKSRQFQNIWKKERKKKEIASKISTLKFYHQNFIRVLLLKRNNYVSILSIVENFWGYRFTIHGTTSHRSNQIDLAHLGIVVNVSTTDEFDVIYRGTPGYSRSSRIKLYVPCHRFKHHDTTPNAAINSGNVLRGWGREGLVGWFPSSGNHCITRSTFVSANVHVKIVPCMPAFKLFIPV